MGSNSMTTGIVSQQGRLIGGGNKKVFDQTTCPGFPGSSGGGVYLTDGHYMGMLVRGAGETFNLIVPVRRMIWWAKEAGVEWAITDAPMPTDAQMGKLPCEDVGRTWSGRTDAAKHPNHTPAPGPGPAINGIEIKDFFARYPVEEAVKK